MKILRGNIMLSFAGLVLFSAGWVLFAQSPSNKKSRNSDATNARTSNTGERTRRTDTLVELARNAPPEVASDVLLTIASSDLIANKQRKIELIDEAFLIAPQMREPVKRRSWSPMTDTRSGFKHAAFELGLDKLSLQSKAVIKMLPLDRQRARLMFESVTLPQIKPLTCEDSLVYDLDSYYQAMLSVSEQSFSDEEKKAGAHIQFLSDRIEKLSLIAQGVAAVRMAVAIKASPDELSLLIHFLTKALDRIPNDPRSFAFAIDRDAFISTAHRLIIRLRQDGVPVDDFRKAARSFLIKNLSGEVCADVAWIKRGQVRLPAGVDEINREFASPIIADDARPSSLGPKATDVIYWTTPKTKALMKLAKELRFGEGTSALTLEQRQTEEWHRKLLDFLDLIENWKADSEPSQDDYFQEKCNMYRVLVDLCPDDLQRDAVLRAYGTYLKEASGTYKGRIEWILPVKEYLRTLRSKSERSRQSALDPWLSSRDDSLRIYSELTILTAAKS